MGLSQARITNLKDEYEKDLKSAVKVNFSFERKWSNQFPKEAGMYVLYEKGKIIYFGETGNIKGRMKDLRRTLNHSFRRSLGFKLFGEKATSKKKFSEENEVKLNN